MCLQAVETAKLLAEACSDLVYQLDENLPEGTFPHREFLVSAYLIQDMLLFALCFHAPASLNHTIAYPSHTSLHAFSIGSTAVERCCFVWNLASFDFAPA